MGEKDRQQPFLFVQFVQLAFVSFSEPPRCWILFLSHGNALGLSCQLRE